MLDLGLLESCRDFLFLDFCFHFVLVLVGMVFLHLYVAKDSDIVVEVV